MVRPANDRRHAVTALPVGVLFTTERRNARVGPLVEVHAIVGGIDHDGVVGDAQLIEFFQQGADLAVMFEHAVVVLALPRLARNLVADVGVVVHAGGVEPDKERFIRLDGLVHEVG
ncbi:hypothetical protein D3C81_1910530 [compost metagenome]